MNTMYAAVARRAGDRDPARARLLPGRHPHQLFLESLLFSLLGGMIGCLLVLPLNNIQTGLAIS